MRGSNNIAARGRDDSTSRKYFDHSSAPRVNTDLVLVEALRKQFPNHDLIISPQTTLDLVAYATAGFATLEPFEEPNTRNAEVKWRTYFPPSRRLDDGPGVMAERIIFGKYVYHWKGSEFIVYVADGRDGSGSYPEITNNYILTQQPDKTNELIKAATQWYVQLHDEVWVFDQGRWDKSRELWDSVQKSNWPDVILDEDMKKAIIDDVENFFDHRATYENLKVPWKRGLIYYGPPGNGKTISIKAMMHSLYERGKINDKQTVPTLYVRSLASFAGPEYALHMIFSKARAEAPCYLVFEDLDTIVNDDVRSYFLNEVDGLKSNDGILMVGSTNHLDRLDPGISKRPSRFDRKYYFPDPNFKQRVQYAKFWQAKLKDNDEVEFPDKLCEAVAKITDRFSFAYMQEAFVATLLAIAVRNDAGDADRWSGPDYPGQDSGGDLQAYSDSGADDSDLDELVLWKEFKKQVSILREEMDEKAKSETDMTEGTEHPNLAADAVSVTSSERPITSAEAFSYATQPPQPMAHRPKTIPNPPPAFHLQPQPAALDECHGCREEGLPTEESINYRSYYHNPKLPVDYLSGVQRSTGNPQLGGNQNGTMLGRDQGRLPNYPDSETNTPHGNPWSLPPLNGLSGSVAGAPMAPIPKFKYPMHWGSGLQPHPAVATRDGMSIPDYNSRYPCPRVLIADSPNVPPLPPFHDATDNFRPPFSGLFEDEIDDAGFYDNGFHGANLYDASSPRQPVSRLDGRVGPAAPLTDHTQARLPFRGYP